MKRKPRLGTRGSPLARWQAEWVVRRLRELAGVEVEIVTIATQGDRRTQGPIEQIGTSGVFTKEIQRALIEARIDLTVHSLKDLPTEPVEGLCLAAVPPREAEGDVLVSRGSVPFAQLPEGATIGTGSLRRRTQLWHARPDLRMVDLRGNVDTRLQKVVDGYCDATVLAEAGLRRLGAQQQITEVLPKSLILPAAGQGALAIEARADDQAIRDMLAPLDDLPTHAAVHAERALLASLRGGCLAPVGAWGRIESKGRLALTAVVLSADGRQRLEANDSGDLGQAKDLGGRVAAELLSQGAAELIATARSSTP